MRISDWSSDVCSSDLRSWPETAARVPYRARRFAVSAGVSYLAVLPGSFTRRLHTGEHSLAIGNGRFQRGERRAGARFNGSAFTLAPQRGTARAGQGADDRGIFVLRPLAEARLDAGAEDSPH